MKKVFEILPLILFVLSLNSCMSQEQRIKEAIKFTEKEIKEWNNLCPIEVKKGLVAYKSEYLKDKNIIKHSYRFTYVKKSELDDENITAVKEELERELKNELKLLLKGKNPDKVSFVVVESTFIYHYEDKNGEKLFEIKITPSEYK